MKKPLNILHWFNQNQLFVVLLPLIAFYAFILPSWAIVSYFLCWIITYLNLKNKIIKISENIKNGQPTIPSILSDEIECNIFLKAKNVESFSKLRDLKDNF